MFQDLTPEQRASYFLNSQTVIDALVQHTQKISTSSQTLLVARSAFATIPSVFYRLKDACQSERYQPVCQIVDLARQTERRANLADILWANAELRPLQPTDIRLESYLSSQIQRQKNQLARTPYGEQNGVYSILMEQLRQKNTLAYQIDQAYPTPKRQYHVVSGQNYRANAIAQAYTGYVGNQVHNVIGALGISVEHSAAEIEKKFQDISGFENFQQNLDNKTVKDWQNWERSELMPWLDSLASQPCEEVDPREPNKVLPTYAQSVSTFKALWAKRQAERETGLKLIVDPSETVVQAGPGYSSQQTWQTKRAEMLASYSQSLYNAVCHIDALRLVAYFVAYQKSEHFQSWGKKEQLALNHQFFESLNAALHNCARGIFDQITLVVKNQLLTEHAEKSRQITGQKDERPEDLIEPFLRQSPGLQQGKLEPTGMMLSLFVQALYSWQEQVSPDLWDKLLQEFQSYASPGQQQEHLKNQCVKTIKKSFIEFEQEHETAYSLNSDYLISEDERQLESFYPQEGGEELKSDMADLNPRDPKFDVLKQDLTNKINSLSINLPEQQAIGKRLEILRLMEKHCQRMTWQYQVAQEYHQANQPGNQELLQLVDACQKEEDMDLFQKAVKKLGLQALQLAQNRALYKLSLDLLRQISQSEDLKTPAQWRQEEIFVSFFDQMHECASNCPDPTLSPALLAILSEEKITQKNYPKMAGLLEKLAQEEGFGIEKHQQTHLKGLPHPGSIQFSHQNMYQFLKHLSRISGMTEEHWRMVLSVFGRPDPGTQDIDDSADNVLRGLRVLQWYYENIHDKGATQHARLLSSSSLATELLEMHKTLFLCKQNSQRAYNLVWKDYSVPAQYAYLRAHRQDAVKYQPKRNLIKPHENLWKLLKTSRSDLIEQGLWEMLQNESERLIDADFIHEISPAITWMHYHQDYTFFQPLLKLTKKFSIERESFGEDLLYRLLINWRANLFVSYITQIRQEKTLSSEMADFLSLSEISPSYLAQLMENWEDFQWVLEPELIKQNCPQLSEAFCEKDKLQCFTKIRDYLLQVLIENGFAMQMIANNIEIPEMTYRNQKMYYSGFERALNCHLEPVAEVILKNVLIPYWETLLKEEVKTYHLHKVLVPMFYAKLSQNQNSTVINLLLQWHKEKGNFEHEQLNLAHCEVLFRRSLTTEHLDEIQALGHKLGFSSIVLPTEAIESMSYILLTSFWQRSTQQEQGKAKIDVAGKPKIKSETYRRAFYEYQKNQIWTLWQWGQRPFQAAHKDKRRAEQAPQKEALPAVVGGPKNALVFSGTTKTQSHKVPGVRMFL